MHPVLASIPATILFIKCYDIMKLPRGTSIRPILVLVIFTSCLIGVIIQRLQKPVVLLSPLAENQEISLTPTNIPSPTTTPMQGQYNEVQKEIEAVFGTHAPKAFKLLQSKDCPENRGLDPKAKHKNEDKIGSIDWGVFQINDHWQGVTNVAFLTDYRINIRMAWNIFERNGYRFKLWTCGKKLGI